MVMVHLTGRMGREPILSIKWSVSIDTMINFDGDRNGHRDGDGTCKQTLKNPLLKENNIHMCIIMYMKRTYTTRMHSSRMRTSRALTISGGWGCIPGEIFWGGKEIEKKREKKFEEPPPENFRHPPRKLGSPRDQLRYPPLWTDTRV